jgi:hypothetical protein
MFAPLACGREVSEVGMSEVPPNQEKKIESSEKRTIGRLCSRCKIRINGKASNTSHLGTMDVHTVRPC